MGQQPADGVLKRLVPPTSARAVRAITPPHAPTFDSAALSGLERQVVLNFLQASLGAEPSEPLVVTKARVESRYYSFILRFRVRANGGEERFVAKLPKREMRRGLRTIPPRTTEDVVIAQSEYSALLELDRTWPGERSRYVRPLYFDTGIGAFVTPEIRGTDFHSILTVKGKAVARPYLAALGLDLSRYHRANGRLEPLSGALSSRVLRLSEQVESATGLPVRFQVERAVQSLQSRLPKETLCAPGIKGFEVRNAMLGVDGQVWLIDAGKLKWEPAEADLARFAVSCRMIWWGRARFPFQQGLGWAEDAFLQAYHSWDVANRPVLQLLIVRDVLKNWLAGVRATNLKGLPPLIRRLVFHEYVNRGFYLLLRRQLAACA